MRSSFLLLSLFSLIVSSCTCSPRVEQSEQPEPGLPVEPPEGPRDNLRWRTGWAWQQHLMQSLSLSENEACKELGTLPCVTRPAAERPFREENIAVGASVAHLVALGGNDPFDQSHYAPAHTPGATTAVAVDRTALSACDARVEKDRVGAAVVFTELDFTANAVSAAAAATAVTLFSRLHLREASADEIAGIETLSTDDGGAAVAPADFAVAACFTVAALSESIFD